MQMSASRAMRDANGDVSSLTPSVPTRFALDFRHVQKAIRASVSASASALRTATDVADNVDEDLEEKRVGVVAATTVIAPIAAVHVKLVLATKEQLMAQEQPKSKRVKL
jgi:hypothetical protein